MSVKPVLRRSLPRRSFGPPHRVDVVSREVLRREPRWRKAFADLRKDHRYYEIVEDTIMPEFDYRYFVIRDDSGRARSVQPFFLLYQDLLEGCPALVRKAANGIRSLWPNFLKMKTLMLGCAAGEGHLDGNTDDAQADAALLAQQVRQLAIDCGASLIVLKEFPSRYRSALAPFERAGFTRIPSLPMASLELNYADFEDYMKRGLRSRMRSDLRRKFRCDGKPVTMTVMRDVSPLIEQIYPLYLQVYERSDRHFEKLTREYFCALGARMPEKVRFFIWRQGERIVAFSLTMLHNDHICNEYLGLDYDVALERHLYFVAFRDVVSWAIANGFRRCLSTGLGYAPKLDLGFELYPLDLYVRHVSNPINRIFRHMLPFLEPTRYEPGLKRFANYRALREKE